MTSYACGERGDLERDLVITYICIGFLLFFINIVSLYQLSHVHRINGFPQSLRFSQYSFYVSSILFILFRITSSITHCPYPQVLLSRIMWQCLFIVYTVHKLCFLLVLYVKLRLVFDDTPFAASRCTIYSLWFTFLFSFIVPTAAMLIEENMDHLLSYTLYLSLLSAAAFMVLFTVQFMAWSFVFKLKRIGKSMAKYAVLNIVSISFTTIYAVFGVICGAIHSETNSNDSNHADFVYIEQTVFAVVVVMDVLIDTLCMTLSLSVNDKYYRICCYFCAKQRMLSEQADTANASYVEMEDSDKTSSTVQTPTWIRFNTTAQHHRQTTTGTMVSIPSSYL